MSCCGPGQGHGSHGSHGSRGHSQTSEKQFSWAIWIMLFIIIGLLLFGILK